ncbi:MAG: transporter related protein, partial [Paenibacillaceae bacterium]|nr:transporter related protein [Paenibacillaceae bacterium]
MGDFSEIFSGRKMTVTVGTEGATVLDGVDLTIRRGEWLAVVGHSGSGKSTLAKVLAGVCPLASGSAQWRTDAGRVHWVQQNPEAQLIGDTVWEDVTIGLAGSSGEGGGSSIDDDDRVERGSGEDRALEALSRVGLADLREQKTETLSGGQKQLLAIAGALAAGMDTLVLDEATSMLDPVSQESVMEAVEDVHRGGTAIFWATHSLDELAYAERVAVLDKGKFVFEGTPRQFFFGEEGELEAGKRSPCERLGFAPPYTVEVAWELLRRGWSWEWDRLPLRPEDFAV